MTATRPLRISAAIGVAVVTADFAAKVAVTTMEPLRRLPFVLPVQNPGYLLGAGSGLAPGLVSLALLFFVGWRLIIRLQLGAASALAVGLVLGGCVANVAERLVRGSVTDFIRLPWIVLDPADLAVLTGLLLLAVRRVHVSFSHSRMVLTETPAAFLHRPWPWSFLSASSPRRGRHPRGRTTDPTMRRVRTQRHGRSRRRW